MDADEKKLFREILKHVEPPCGGGCETPATRMATCDCQGMLTSYWCDVCTVPLIQFNQTKWVELPHAQLIRTARKALARQDSPDSHRR